MTTETNSQPLLVALMKQLRISWRSATTVIAAVLVLYLFLVSLLTDNVSNLLEWEFLRDHIEPLFLIVYVLVVYPIMWRLRNQALQAFKPILNLDDIAFTKLVKKVSAPNRKREWGAVLGGVVFTVILGQPWSLDWGSGETGLSLYMVVVAILFWGLMGWLIYDTLTGIVRINRVSRLKLNLDVFNTGMLTPISRWSLGISAVFIGGISLSLLFSTQEQLLSLNSIIIYSVLVIVTLLIFFLSMRSIHDAIVEAKQQKLILSQKHLALASHELENRAIGGQLEGIGELSSTVAAWAAYEKHVQETSEWPFNTAIIRRLFASILIPASVYMLKILSALGIRFGA